MNDKDREYLDRLNSMMGGNPDPAEGTKNSAPEHDAKFDGRGFHEKSRKHWFTKGHKLAGGRKNGSKNKPKAMTNTDFRQVALEEASRLIELNDSTGPLTMSVFRAVMRAEGVRGAKRGGPSAHRWLKLVIAADREERHEREEARIGIGEYLAKAEEYRSRMGGLPSYVLDPQELIFDNEYNIIGHRRRASRKENERWEMFRVFMEYQLASLEAELKRANGRKRVSLEKEVEQVRNLIQVLELALRGSPQAMVQLDGIAESIDVALAELSRLLPDEGSSSDADDPGIQGEESKIEPSHGDDQ